MATQIKQTNGPFIMDMKFNCDVSDAKYWGYFSICGLLMRYRDLFRSEKGLPPWAEIRRSEITEWIDRKESRWPELEKQDFKDVTIDGASYHPFDIFEINKTLAGRGLVYGAGYGMYLKPTFFLARLTTREESMDHTVYTSDREVVRDLFTAPAMLQGRCIFLRREPLKVLLWEKFAELSAGRGSALEHAFSQYGLLSGQPVDDAVEHKLDAMAARYCDVLLYHELAESREDIPEWNDIVSAAGDRKSEHYVRAVKDLIADTSDYGPLRKIVQEKDQAALSLFVGLAEGYRKLLYPEMKETYRELLSTGNWDSVEQARTAGHARFQKQREAIINLYRTSRDREDFMKKLRGAVQGSSESMA